MGHETETRQSFLRRIAKDSTANTIAISAASLVPLMAMVGGGVDASRYYMADARLQAACDAGALAARRAMEGDTLQSSEKQVGLNFFDQNYPDGTFGLQNLSRDYSETDGTVTGTASGDLPTSIMGAFGYNEFELDVTCSAEINISNTDIMFVLDVTGSMNCPTTSTSCSNNGEVEDSDAKIKGLRTAVMSFYDTVEGATSQSAQVRYGIVPYATNVNVGASLDPTWLATSHTYQSRVANWSEAYTEEVTDTETENSSSDVTEFLNETSENYIGYTQNSQSANRRQCNRLEPDDIDPYYPDFDEGDWDATITTSGSSGDTSWTQTTYTQDDVRLWRADGYSYRQSGTCYYGYYVYQRYADIRRTVRDEETTTTTTTVVTYPSEFEDYTYQPVTFDLTSLYDDNIVTLPTGYQGADENHVWNGCIEEADTVATATWNPVNANAYDLDIDLVPSTDAERWRPFLPNAVYLRYRDGYNYWDSSGWTYANYTTTSDKTHPRTDLCPKAAMRLTELERTELESYISASNGFVAKGSTYHDFGMIWGARFITPDGIFAATNAAAPNGDAIARHIVFMTDGTQSTSQRAYGNYGVEYWDRRVTNDGSSSQMSDRHASRFQAACRAARNKNISVWVVAFGTTLSQNLIDCATPGRAYSASDSEALDDAFKEIAEKIAALRLTA